MGGGRGVPIVLPAVGPSPDGGPLELMVECRTSRTALRGDRHPVVIHADWSVATPHDLDAERVAVAFGGYTSCMELVDETVPAFHAAMHVLTRCTRLPVRRDKRGRWRIMPAHQIAGCCRLAHFSTIAAAGVHLRNPPHLARQHGVPEWQLGDLMEAAAPSWGEWEGAPHGAEDVRHLVREVGGPTDLWRAGVRPDDVLALAQVASAVREPLPVSYYLGMAYGPADAEWVRELVAHRPDGDTAAWLAWSDSPRNADSAQWAAWLDLGVPRRDVRFAVESGLDPQRVPAIADRLGSPLGVTARDVVRWAEAGCHPTAEHFAFLARYGLEHTHPHPGSVDALVKDADHRALAQMPDRTELAVMLLVLGTRQLVLGALAGGVRSLADIEGAVGAKSRRSA